MVKETMAHRSLLRFALVFVLTTSLVKSQLLFQNPIRPLYFVQRGGNDGRNPQPPQDPSMYHRRQISDDGPIARGRSDLVADSSEEDQNDDDAGSPEVAAPAGVRRNATQLPRNFDEVVSANRPAESRPAAPLYGDPAVMDDDDEQERSRFLWPFQTTVSISKQKRIHPHHAHPPPHHHLSHFQPPLLPPHLSQQHHHDPHDLEYEKTRLKYEIYKLKAKKTIAILQNKVELKKILSLLLQQKIKALEWITWYHDYVEQMYNAGNGDWGGDGGDGWGESKYLTDEEILHSKGLKSSYSWSSLFGGGLLTRLRTSLNLDKNDKSTVQILNESEASGQKQHQQQPPLDDGDEDDDDDDDNDDDGNQPSPPSPARFDLQQPTASQNTPSPTVESNKKPFYRVLFKNPLLKYLGYQKESTEQNPSPSPPPPLPYQQLSRHDIHSAAPPQTGSHEESDETNRDDDKSSNENIDHEEANEDDDDNDKEEDEDNNDDNNNGDENDSDGADDEKSKEEENHEDDDDDDNAEKEDKEEQEDDEQDGEGTAIVEPEIQNESKEEEEEEETTTNGDVNSKENRGEDDADIQEDEEDEKPKDKLKIDIDIDEELADIELQNHRPPSNSLASKLFRTGAVKPEKKKDPPKDKKKVNLKNKVYSFLFKTMDVLDKKFMNGDEEEEDPLLEARKKQ